MGKRGLRPLKKLYDLTDRIAEPEITPVLEGNCRIQGPVDELHHHRPRTDSATDLPSMFPGENRCAFLNENFNPKTKSGTCNMCSAPCSSCMHLNRTASFMESNVDCPFPGNNLERKEDDTCSFIGVDELPFYKNGACDNNQHAASETSNLLSASSTYDPYTENAESRAMIRASVTCDPSNDVDMPSKMSSSEFVKDLSKKTNVTSRSQGHIASDIGCKTYSSQDEEQHGLECHGDNISSITAVRDAKATVVDHNLESNRKDVSCSSGSTRSLLAKEIKDEAQVETASGLDDHKIEENQNNSRSPSIFDKESSRKKSSVSDSAEASISDKPGLAEFPPSKSISPNVQSLCLNPPKEHSSLHDADSKGNPSTQVQAEPFKCSTEIVKCSSRGQLASDRAIGQKSTVAPNCEDNKASSIKSDNSSAALRETDPCLETEIQPENSNAFMEASEMQVSRGQVKQNVGDEKAESDGGLDDVKVCDICGDVGREELLAICSRCSDGAEHTYCMRKRLDKIPDNNWLCEECKTSVDAETLKADESESASETSKSACLDDKFWNLVGTSSDKSCDKLLRKFNTKMNDQEVRGVVKGLQSSQVSSMRHGDDLLYSSVTSKRDSAPSGGSVGIVSPRKKTILSRENSFKNLELGEVKRVKMGASVGGQPANNAPILKRLQTSLGSNSFKDQTRLQSPRVQISRSNSLNSSNSRPSPKVTQSENVPHKLKTNRESTLINSGKKGLIRPMIKSASYKSGNSDPSNIELVGKTFISSRSESSSGSKQVKERNVPEKKNSSVLDHPSPLASTSMLLSQVNLKVAQHNGRLKTTSLKGLSISKVSEDGKGAGSKEEKLQFSSKNFGSQSSYGMCNSEEQKPCQISKDGVRASFAANDRSRSKDNEISQRNATQAAKIIVREDKTKDARDDKIKESPLFSSPKKVVSGGNQILRCQRCNETGHATHLCPVDKLRTDALKPSAELSLKEGIKKSNKWKDAVEATNMKTGIQKSNILADKSKKIQLPRVGSSCEVTSKDILSNSSSCARDLPFPERSTHGQETVSGLHAEHSQLTDIDMRLMHPVNASYVTPASDSNIILSTSDELNARSSNHTFPDQASVLANQFRASAIPELDFIWQGDFEVIRTGRLPELFQGIQAHLSTCASPKIPEMVTKFPCKVQLEEVSRRSSWPSQFRGSRPEKDNIALYFFAKDIESYEKSYSRLLENMLTNDLALRGNTDGAELLIFPSNTLPANSQCWNKLFFLWGVFRSRRMHCLEAIPGSEQRSCRSILSTDPLVRFLPSPLINNVLNSQKINSTENWGMELSGSDRSSKLKEVISTASTDCCPVSSSRIDDLNCNTGVLPLVGNSLYQAGSNHKLPSFASFPVNCSSKSMYQHLNLLNSCPETNLHSSANMWCPEGNIGGVYMECTDTAREEVEVAKPPSHIQSKDLHGVEGCQSEKKKREEHKSMRTEAALEDDHQDYLKSNHQSWESRPSMKRAHSSGEMAPHVSSEISRSIDETELWMERKIHVNIEDGREHKKMKPCVEECASNSFRGENLSGMTSTKEHPLLGTFLNGQQQRDGASGETVKFVSSTAAERCFFSVDLGPGRYTKSDNVINISMDDEDMPQSHVSILKVDPGDDKKSGKQKELSLLLPLADTRGCQDGLPGPAGDDEQTVLPLLFSLGRNGNQERRTDHGADNDVTLSLSLGLPSTPKPVIKTEHLMPGEPHINTSLHLFSGFPDT